MIRDVSLKSGGIPSCISRVANTGNTKVKSENENSVASNEILHDRCVSNGNLNVSTCVNVLRSGKQRGNDKVETIGTSKENIDIELLKRLQRSDKHVSLLIEWKEKGHKPIWKDVAKYGVELKFYWNRFD